MVIVASQRRTVIAVQRGGVGIIDPEEGSGIQPLAFMARAELALQTHQL